MNKKLEWTYRIICVFILQSLITVVSYVTIVYSTQMLIETNNLNWKTQIGLIQAALGFMYLQVANIFYWIMGINLFNFKTLTNKEVK